MQATACLQQAQKEVAAAGSSVAVVSTGFSSLSGTYSFDPTAIMHITATVAGIAAGQGFPGGADTMIWVDTAGAPHTFASIDEFVAFGAAIEGYVYALQMAALKQPVTIPATPLQIP